MSLREKLTADGYTVLTPSQIGGFYCPLKNKLERESEKPRTNLKAYIGTVTHRIIEALLLGDAINPAAAARADLNALEAGEAVEKRSGKKIEAMKVEI